MSTQMMKYVIGSIFFLFQYSIDFSQEIFIRNYSVEDGLPSNETYDVVQDNEGYIWIASELGATKYDGYTFTTYNFDTTDIDNAILRLYKDPKGRIWFISINGLLAYYENDSIKLYKNNDKIKPLVGKNGVISSFYADENMNIDFGVRGLGLLKMNDDTVYLDDFDKEYDQDTSHTYIYEEKDHINFYTTTQTIPRENTRDQRLKLNGEKWLRFNYYAGHGSYFNAVQLGEKKWICTYYKSFFILDNEMVKMIHGFPKGILYLKQDSEGKCWLGCNDRGGLYQYDMESNKITHFMDGLTISSVNFDLQGGIWCTSLERGLFYAQDNSIELYLNDYSEENIITDFESSNDSLYVLSINGPIFNIIHDSVSLLASENIDNNRYWIKKVRNNIFTGSNRPERTYRLENGQQIPVIFNSWNSVYGYATHITEDSIYMTAYGYGSLVIPIDNVDNFYLTTQGMRVGCAYQSNKGIYLGNNSGLWLYNFDYLENISEKKKIKGRVKSITIDKNGRIITGMKESGVFIVTPDSTYQISVNNGLSSNYTQFVTSEQDTIWCGTKDGINKIVLTERNGEIDFDVFNITRKDGLVSSDVKKIIPHKNAIWSLTPKGIIKVARKNFIPQKDTLIFILDSVFVNDTLMSFSDNMSLNYWENDLKFHFTAIDFHPYDELTYYYRLTPNDDETHTTNNRSINYSNLQPGEYTFTLYASNEKSQSKTYTLSFNILSPWWQTWWFYTFEIIVIASILVVVFKIRSRVLIKRAVKKETIEKEKIELKLKALRAQMNPHFMFNSLNSILYYILENDINLAAKYLSKFSKLVRAILQNSEEGNVALENEISTLNLYLELEQLRLENKFDFSITNTIGEKSKSIKIPTLLIQPVIENAVWHGMSKKKGKGKIDVLFELEEEIIVVSVTDDGVGRSATVKNIKINTEFQKKSMGIKITKERLNMLNSNMKGKLQYEVIDLFNDGTPAGTKVIIRVPVQ